MVIVMVVVLCMASVGGWAWKRADSLRSDRDSEPVPATVPAVPLANRMPSPVAQETIAPAIPSRPRSERSPGRLLMTSERQQAFVAMGHGQDGEEAPLREQVRQTMASLHATIASGGGGDFTLRDHLLNAALYLNAARDSEDGPKASELASAVVAFGRHLQGLRQQNPVARGAMTVSLAMTYDLLHDTLDRGQRRELAQVLVDQAIVIALGGSFRPRGTPRRQWWADSATNWSTLIIGGSVLSALAIRDEDAPAMVRISNGTDGEEELPWSEVRRTAVVDGLAHLERCFLPIIRNGGGTNEGHGYHHDMLLPLMLVAEAVHLHQSSPEGRTLSPQVGSFLERASEAARWQIHGNIHVSTPLPGVDFDYADGVWTLSDQPVTFLVATWARRAGEPGWRAAAWMANQRCLRPSAMRTVFRSDMAWLRTGLEHPAGMADFHPDVIPKGRHLFHQTIPVGEPGTNEHLVIWRQRFADPLAAAVMFKGGDRRQDRHSALDAGTFTYVGQGVMWNRRPGWIGDYRYYYRDNRPSGKEMTFLHLFAKRAVGQNTLLVNPADNDYSQGRIPAPMTWLSQVNPDQAVGEDRISQPTSPVDDVDMPSQGPWSAFIRYAPAYARHGVIESRGEVHSARRMAFDPLSGALEVMDQVVFKRQEKNEAIWGMHLSREVAVEALEEDRVLLSAVALDQRRVYLEVVRSGPGPSFRLHQGEELAPPGAPPHDILWRYRNGDLHRRTSRRLVLAEADVGGSWTMQVRLNPLPALAEASSAEARRRWASLGGGNP